MLNSGLCHPVESGVSTLYLYQENISSDFARYLLLGKMKHLRLAFSYFLVEVGGSTVVWSWVLSQVSVHSMEGS